MLEDATIVESTKLSQSAYVAYQTGGYPGFGSIKCRTRSISTPPWMGCKSITELNSVAFASTHLNTWVERGTVRVKGLDTLRAIF